MLMQVVAGFWLGVGLILSLVAGWRGLPVNLAGLLLLGWWGQAETGRLVALTGVGLVGTLAFAVLARHIGFTPRRFFTPLIIGLVVGLLARPLAGLLTLGGLEFFRLAGGGTRGWKVWLAYFLGVVIFTLVMHLGLWFDIFY